MKTMCPPGYHHNGFVATLSDNERNKKFSKLLIFKLSKFLLFLSKHYFHNFQVLNPSKLIALTKAIGLVTKMKNIA